MDIPKRRLLVSTIIAVLGLASASVAAGQEVVLGSGSFAGPQGAGWGTVRPREIFNGGDPSGLVTHIRWAGWGRASALGSGRNAIFKPNGGYYAQLVTIQLRATDRGRCTATGPLAYQKLYVRVPSRPGGRLGKWLLWSGAKNICTSGF